MPANETLKKNWIFILGGAFLFFSFLYGMKLILEEIQIPEAGKIGIGLFLSLSCLLVAFLLYNKSILLLSEVSGGFGITVLLATSVYASFLSSAQWSSNTLFLVITAISGVVAYFAYTQSMRVLVNICVVGGLMTPIVMKASEEQVLLLFLYVLVLNGLSIYVSAVKHWQELRYTSFLVTLAIYFTYYIHFAPADWPKPFFYISSIFFVYMAGLFYASWTEKDNFVGPNLYLGLVNALSFTIWSIAIFDKYSVGYTIPLFLVGIVFIIAGSTIYKLTKKSLLPSSPYLFIGVFLFAISVSSLWKLFDTKGMEFVFMSLSYYIIATFVYTFGILSKHYKLSRIGTVMFIFLLLYWYGVAWSVEWPNWFGLKYIPFFNPGGIVWMIFAASCFYLSLKSFDTIKDEKGKVIKFSKKGYELFYSIIGHIVVGGLLTIQIQNFWKAYELNFIRSSIILSFSWMVYSLVLFLWGAHTKSIIYRSFGSIVLLFTSTKVFLSDLEGIANAYKALFLFILGILVMGIALINRKWANEEEVITTETNQSDGSEG